jgi:hypothetical protein
MTQAELNRAVACATGESVSAIAEMGFVTLTPIPVEREPMVVDWDQLDQQRVSVFPQRSKRQTVAA